MDRHRGYSYCSVYGCTNTSRMKTTIAYFKHPADVERRKKWLELIGRPELINKPATNYCVCEEHFHVRDVIFGKKRRTLSATALPALNLPRNVQPEPSVVADLSNYIKTEIKTEIDDDIEPEMILPDVNRKRRSELPLPGCSKVEKLEEPHQGNKVVVIGHSEFKKMCDKFMTKDLAELAKAQCTLQLRLEEKNKNIRNQKLCLNLYLNSPRVYLMLQNILGLPSPKTLNFGSISTNTNMDMMKMIGNKVKNMTTQEKECSVLTKTISLKTSLLYSLSEDKIIGFQEIDGKRTSAPAVRAQVIMVRGIFADWKQLVGYALLSKSDNSNSINEWTDVILEKLVGIGLNIRTFVSDTGNEFIKGAENRAVTIEKPYFFIGNRKIYHIFEAPHLILMARNHFLLYDFAYEDRLAKYAHVKLFYEKDKTREVKNAPKLTRHHISPTNFDKMNLKYATQIFSNTVATGISNGIGFGFIECSGRVTAEFIKLMNNLFDCLNSSDLKDNDYEYKNAFRGNELQIDFLNEMLIYFRNLKLIHPKDGSDVTHQAKFIKGFQTTIKSVLLLFEDLKSEGYTYLLTRRLNLEILDLFVDRIRTNTGVVSEPTSWQFVSAFRKSFFANILKLLKHKATASELSDFLGEIKKINPLAKKGLSRSDEDSSYIKSCDYNQFEVPVDNCLFQVSHYLLKKCAEFHMCRDFELFCKPYMVNQNFSEDMRYQLYSAYSNANSERLIVIPSDDFVKYVKNMDMTFVACFKRLFMSNNLAASLSAKLIELNFTRPCACFSTDYLVNLFVRFRIYNILKSNIKQFRSSKDETKSMIVKCL